MPPHLPPPPCTGAPLTYPPLPPCTGAPRLYDLIKFRDEALRPAFFFAMGNTVVASDLDQATRIAYGKDGRFKRVVTMQVGEGEGGLRWVGGVCVFCRIEEKDPNHVAGPLTPLHSPPPPSGPAHPPLPLSLLHLPPLQGQLISESGTMSGGGGRPSRGRMALGTAAPKGPSGGGPADAKAAQAELRQAEQQLEEATQVRGVGGGRGVGSGGAAAGGGNAGGRGGGERGMYTSMVSDGEAGMGCIATAVLLMGPEAVARYRTWPAQRLLLLLPPSLLVPPSSHQALRSARDKVAACEAALKAAERQLSDLETSVPRARMEAEAEAAKAQDIQQRLDELRAATEVWGSVDGGWRRRQKWRRTSKAGRLRHLNVRHRRQGWASGGRRAPLIIPRPRPPSPLPSPSPL